MIMLKPIGKESVVDIVVNQIKNLILSEELKPGDKIPTEVELIEQLDVGRNSVREAIKMLTALGILEVRRGQGTFVATEVKPTYFDPLIFSMMIEPKTNKDLYEFRFMYDTMVGFAAMNNSTEEDYRALENNVKEVEEAYKAGISLDSTDFYAEKDIEFHHLLMQATHNPLIIRLGESILVLFERYIATLIEEAGGVSRSIRNHRNILNSIKEQDTNLLMDQIDESLKEWKDNWQE